MSVYATAGGTFVVRCDLCVPGRELPEQSTPEIAEEAAARRGFTRRDLFRGAVSHICPRCVANMLAKRPWLGRRDDEILTRGTKS